MEHTLLHVSVNICLLYQSVNQINYVAILQNFISASWKSPPRLYTPS